MRKNLTPPNPDDADTVNTAQGHLTTVRRQLAAATMALQVATTAADAALDAVGARLDVYLETGIAAAPTVTPPYDLDAAHHELGVLASAIRAAERATDVARGLASMSDDTLEDAYPEDDDHPDAPSYLRDN